jgi:hypothetical protein
MDSCRRALFPRQRDADVRLRTRCRLQSAGLLFALSGLPLGLFGLPLHGQQVEAVVEREENFRAEPNGTILGELTPGTRLVVEGRQGNWVRVTLEGHVWTRSMQLLPDGELDLVISEPDGENIRDEPQGRLAGRLVRGAQLEELERIPGWVRVRRTGWIWMPSVTLSGEVETEAEGPIPVARDPAEVDPPDTFPAPDAAAPDRPPFTVDGWGRELFRSPDGGRLGSLDPGSTALVLEEDGEWLRVRVEGWVRIPGEVGEVDVVEEVVVDVTADELRRDPEGFRGRRVRMEVEFISREEAEPIRRDFQEGEPFLLTRSTRGARAFVYLVLPPEGIGEAAGLAPLERIRVEGRVRTGAAEFTGNPVLELLRLERVR